MKYNYKEIGERIRIERKEKARMAQEKLIEKMQEKKNGIGRNMLSNAENGDFGKMTLTQFLTICDILGCDAGYLLGEYFEHSYDLHFVCEKTKLTERAVDRLMRWDQSGFDSFAGDFISRMIEDEALIGELLRAGNEYTRFSDNNRLEEKNEPFAGCILVGKKDLFKFLAYEIQRLLTNFAYRYFNINLEGTANAKK